MLRVRVRAISIAMVVRFKEYDVLALLNKSCQEAGGVSSFARANGLSPAYVSQALSKIRKPGPAILNALGLKRVVLYEKVK